MRNKFILDACCGARMFWFEKNHPNALYIDRRIISPEIVGSGKNARKFEVNPDHIMDFRNLKYENESFSLVVFDPPHLTSAGPKSYMQRKYGLLDATNWKNDISQGFNECFRVLKEQGVLIFKWNEHDISLQEILALSPYPALFGHKSGKRQLTHWVCFMKIDKTESHEK